jgi:hypothetical protein
LALVYTCKICHRQVVAGISPLCDKSSQDFGDVADRRRLGPIADIDFAPDGTLYLLESSQKKRRPSTVYHVDRHKRIRPIERHLQGGNASSILQASLS